MKNKKGLIIIFIVAIFVLLLVVYKINSNNEIRTVRSEKELYELYKGERHDGLSIIERLLTLPFSLLVDDYDYGRVYVNATPSTKWSEDKNTAEYAKSGESSKDYSKTNIQVEGVDEADIIKTDGDYIYSISENKVIITNVKNPSNPIIESTIYNDDAYPNDLLLYKNKLVVISAELSNSRYNYDYYYGYYDSRDTIVEVYDIKQKDNPKRLKSFELQEPYFTTRCIEGKLYIFSKGYLRKDDNNKKVLIDYKEDYKKKKININNIYYINDYYDNYQTLIAELDLNDIKDVKVSSYLIDISNAYISQNNIYLLDKDYDSNKVSIGSIFGWKGIFGLIDIIEDDYSYDINTRIFKFNIDKSKGIKYQTSTKIEGTTINQYSLDEKDGNLRIALETDDGTRIAILDKNLKLLGETEKLEEDEKMYASRFIGDKAYLVTYRNTDPLFVIDLSDPRNPLVLGELKIPGYSTYLHPYDDNHLIGIGMETEEVINRDSNGKVLSSWVRITGMKMSIFDVTDISNPKEIDKTIIGDSRTASAILTNPKALLFSKEKELLAIPVNNYQDEFTVEDADDYETEIDNYTSRNDYVSEGYFIYHVDLKGFKLKGVINHEEETKKNYYYYYQSKLLRGLYIEDNLYTVSEKEIKVNRLSDLEEIGNLKIKKENR